MPNFFPQSLCLLVAASCLTAADLSWTSKPPNQWTEKDARQILAKSPWSRETQATITRRLTEEQLREGGQLGQPHGLGYDGLDPKGSGPTVSPNIFTGAGGDDRSPRSLPRPLTLRLRWETALPVQLAELKSHESAPPTLEGDGYRIAIYDIPDGDFNGDPVRLGAPLRNQAALKREGKKDVRPVSVEVFRVDNGVVVVYLFPLTAEITKKDQLIEFEAQIGRIVVDQSFDLSQMYFQGKLEL